MVQDLRRLSLASRLAEVEHTHTLATSLGQ